MKTTPRSESEATRLSTRKLLKNGWYPAKIMEAMEGSSKKGNEMMELSVAVMDVDGQERTFRDWLTNSQLGALKLRHAADAVGALAKYEAGAISQADFPGALVMVQIGTEKRRGYPEQNLILDYRASSVVKIRQTA